MQPFASLVDRVSEHVPRSLWNREAAGVTDAETRAMIRKLRQAGLNMPGLSSGFVFEGDGQYRDVFLAGDCDATARAVAGKLGWLEELDAIMEIDAHKFHRPVPVSEPGESAAIPEAVPAGAAMADAPPSGDESTIPAAPAGPAEKSVSQDASPRVKHVSGLFRGTQTSTLFEGAEGPASPFELLLR